MECNNADKLNCTTLLSICALLFLVGAQISNDYMGTENGRGTRSTLRIRQKMKHVTTRGTIYKDILLSCIYKEWNVAEPGC